MNQQEYCLMASMNNETKSMDLDLAVCTDPSGGEFDVIDMDWRSTIAEIILPICMLNCLFQLHFISIQMFFFIICF